VKLNFISPSIISKRDLAKHLHVHVCTINRYIQAGKLPKPFKLPFRTGPTCPSYFNLADIKALLREPLPESMVAKAGERAQYLELDVRVKRIASVLGVKPIKELLAFFDTEYLDALHPNHYPAFRTKLARIIPKPQDGDQAHESRCS